MNERPPQYSEPWKGQDGKQWRTVRFWLGSYYGSAFLEWQDELGNWWGW